MGQTLSEPSVDKTSEKGGNASFAYGLSGMQGWRISMEDAHAAVLDLRSDDEDTKNAAAAKIGQFAFFAVYDGHGGSKVAQYAGENMHKIIARQSAFSAGNIEQALKDGFLATDRAILSDPRYEEEVSGCTASVAIISSEKVFVGNAGDSRTVLGVKGRAKPLSFDHKPQNEGEKARITAAGGFVDFGRVNGNLALSRAIGDFEFKKSSELAPEQQIVTAYPDVVVHDISEDDEFVVIACDGIWDCQSSQAVVEFVRRGIAAHQDLDKICENMMDNCLAPSSDSGGIGCDNMTMTVVALLQGKSLEEWYTEIATRVSNGDGPCAPPSFAEVRGPNFGGSPDEDRDLYDLDERTKGLGQAGRIILLGDGTEVLTDADDADLFDHEEEDKDLASQIRPGGESDSTSEQQARSEREGTPAPDSRSTNEPTPEPVISSTPEKALSPAPEKLTSPTSKEAPKSPKPDSKPDSHQEPSKG